MTLPMGASNTLPKGPVKGRAICFCQIDSADVTNSCLTITKKANDASKSVTKVHYTFRNT